MRSYPNGYTSRPRAPFYVRHLKCQLIFAVYFNPARELEMALHQEFAATRIKATGHWPNRSEGDTEWFVPDNRMRQLVRTVLTLGYWPWDGSKVIQ